MKEVKICVIIIDNQMRTTKPSYYIFIYQQNQLILMPILLNLSPNELQSALNSLPSFKTIAKIQKLANSANGRARPNKSISFKLRFIYLFVLSMGNKESEQAKDFDIEISHPRFIRSKIISRDGQKYLQTSQAIEEKQYEKWRASLAKFNQIPDSLLLPKTHNFSRNGMCGNTGTLQINYDNHPYLLFEEIYHRRGLKRRFSQPELWDLLLTLSEGRREAEAVGEGLGDIRPKNIFLNEEGKIKVSSSLSWPLENTNIQKSFDKVATYLAPEDLESIKKGETIDIPSNSSEAFSIGLTVLSAANLADYEGLYDLQDTTINLSSLNEALGAWAFNSFYSEVLRGTVLLLLNVHPQKRLNCHQLYDLLKEKTEAIRKKENFMVSNAPAKLHQEIQHLRTLAQQPSLQQQPQ